LKPLRVAVVGAGWAGIAAAVYGRKAGHEVEVFEMAAHCGGRARTVRVDGLPLDNGQHILIGAYQATLALMHEVGADATTLLRRMPLALQFPDGQGLMLRRGAPVPAFVRAVLGRQGWSWGDRLALLTSATRWAAMRFRCDDGLSVAGLCRSLPATVQADLIEPLCVAALNTPASQASAAVFLRVLRDALFSGAGSSDLLLPCAPLGSLLPQPAADWLQRHGVRLHHGARVTELSAESGAWRLNGERFDAVVLACTAAEAARLSKPISPRWALTAAALRYEPIVTVYLRCPHARLALPMVALHADAGRPAQFAFDLGALDGPPGVFAFVISGAREWVDRGLEATAAATLAQALAAFPSGTWPSHAHTAAHGRREAGHLPLHARPCAPPGGHRPALVGCRRLCRRALPGHAGRRGARRARRCPGPGLISGGQRARPAARRRTAIAAATARFSSRLRSRCCPAGSAAAAIADAETSAGGCRAR
jgi:hydroxysqualene dehydroxylase